MTARRPSQQMIDFATYAAVGSRARNLAFFLRSGGAYLYLQKVHKMSARISLMFGKKPIGSGSVEVQVG